MRFFVEASADEGKTAYAAYIQLPDTTWKQLATFRTRDGQLLRGLYAFIEDFRRDGTSATQMRRASFPNPSVKDASGQWWPITQAKFTASGADWEAKDTIDAGVAGHDFYLQTGGETQATTRLGSVLTREVGKP
ncbi:MAG: DUF3472 domain-containing protein [Tepidisphaeraceae bacterium]